MITEATIQGFRCLRNVRVELEPLTVLVGPNASGKSAFVDALGGALVREEDRWHHGPGNIDFRIRRSAGSWDFRLPEDTNAVPDRPYSSLVLRFALSRLRASYQALEVGTMESDGAQITNVFAALGRHGQASVAQKLSELVPPIGDVDVVPSGASGYLRFRFRDQWDAAVEYTPDQVSDGTMLVLGLLVALHQRPPADLLLVEEPERGVHPFLLRDIVGLMRMATEGKLVSRPVQVIMATHSAELLDHVRPEEVRFFSRDVQSGETRVTPAPLDDEGWARAYDEYQTMGQLWLSGGIGGVP